MHSRGAVIGYDAGRLVDTLRKFDVQGCGIVVSIVSRVAGVNRTVPVIQVFHRSLVVHQVPGMGDVGRRHLKRDQPYPAVAAVRAPGKFRKILLSRGGRIRGAQPDINLDLAPLDF